MLILPPATAASLKIAIVGGGLMGHALAAVMVASGAETSVVETDASLRANLAERMDVVLAECASHKIAAECTRIVTSIADLPTDTQLVIEAIPEDLLLKQELFERLEHTLPHAILATNSSVYRVGDVARRMSDPSRAIGTHWWNPPHLIPVVEVIQGEQTPSGLVTWMMDVLRSAGKTPVHVCKDTAGFIGNRMQHALWREALALVDEGVADAETVDMVARNTLGMKLGVLGPLENADYIGLDLTHAIHKYLLPGLSRSVSPSPQVTNALNAGQLGAKTGSGLMNWPNGRKQDVAERLAKYVRQQLSSIPKR